MCPINKILLAGKASSFDAKHFVTFGGGAEAGCGELIFNTITNYILVVIGQDVYLLAATQIFPHWNCGTGAAVNKKCTSHKQRTTQQFRCHFEFFSFVFTGNPFRY